NMSFLFTMCPGTYHHMTCGRGNHMGKGIKADIGAINLHIPGLLDIKTFTQIRKMWTQKVPSPPALKTLQKYFKPIRLVISYQGRLAFIATYSSTSIVMGLDKTAG